MKVALVYPGITACGFNSLKGNEGSWINHGLAILSAALKQKGHEVELLDLRRLSGWGDLEDRARRLTSQAVGITVMSVDFNAATRTAEIVKRLRPDVKVFVGGPHASICPEEFETLDCVDCIVKGEAEKTLPQLVADLAAGREIPRVVQGERLENLDEAPWADRDLFKGAEEPFVPFLKPPFVTLIAGRGCRYNCSFCQPAERLIFGPKVRRRSVGNVIGELKALRDRYHFNSFMIHDDCLTEDPAWIMEFCGCLREEGFARPFVAQSRADLVCKNPDMAKALYDAGLRLLIVGFESGSDRVLKFLRKGSTRAQNIEAARICRNLGIKVWANYMLGIPTETQEEVLETLSMLEEIQPYHCSPAFYTPHPGSDLFEMGKKEGIHLALSHDAYRRNTYEPKIRGVDYDFLTKILYRSAALAEDQRQRLALAEAGQAAAQATPTSVPPVVPIKVPILRRGLDVFKVQMKKRLPRTFHAIKTLYRKVRR